MYSAVVDFKKPFDPVWFVHLSNDAMIAVGPDSEILFVNAAAENLLDKDHTALIGTKPLLPSSGQSEPGADDFLGRQIDLARQDGSTEWNSFYAARNRWLEVRVERIAGCKLFFLQDISKIQDLILSDETAPENLLQVLRQSGMGLWDYDYTTQIVREWFHFGAPVSVPATPVPLSELLARVHPSDTLRVSHAIRSGILLESGLEYQIQKPEGGYRWVFSRGRLVRDSDEQPRRLVGLVVDTTAQKEAESRQKQKLQKREALVREREQALYMQSVTNDRSREFSRNASLGTWEYDLITGAIRWSDDVYSVFGLPVGSPPTLGEYYALIHPDDLPRIQQAITDCIEQGINYALDHRIIWKDGSVHHVQSTGAAVSDSSGTIISLMGTALDITERNAIEEKVRWLAYHDALTELPNRTQFREQIEAAISRAEESRHEVGILFLDLDGFKHINDTFGHERGDKLLKIVASRVRNAVRSNAMVARMGGDEFTILLPVLKSQREPEDVANRLLRVLSETISLEGNELVVTASIGIGIYPYDGRDVETLLRHSDRAMYEAKGKGRNTYQTHSIEANVAAFNRLLLENSLRRALQNKDLYLLYQPQMRLATGKIEAVEALLRWNHADIGDVPRQHFIPLAEETGLIKSIGDWVIRQACQQASLWRNPTDLTLPMRLAINLSARQLSQPGLVDTVQQALAISGLPPTALELELTESAIIWNGVHAVDTLRELRSIGVRLSVDDFGTGYSSLSYLRRFPLDCVKIDQTFVAEITEDKQTLAIVKAVIDLSHALNLSVIAEGVETEEQRLCLADLGCDLIQGYLICEPVSAEAIQRLYYTLQSASSLPLVKKP